MAAEEERVDREKVKIRIVELHFLFYIYVSKLFYSTDMSSSSESLCNGQSTSQTR